MILTTRKKALIIKKCNLNTQIPQLILVELIPIQLINLQLFQPLFQKWIWKRLRVWEVERGLFLSVLLKEKAKAWLMEPWMKMISPSCSTKFKNFKIKISNLKRSVINTRSRWVLFQRWETSSPIWGFSCTKLSRVLQAANDKSVNCQQVLFFLTVNLILEGEDISFGKQAND